MATNFPAIMTDHYTPAKQVIRHLIEVHGYKDIAYLTGKKNHPHSIQRLQAFLDCMEEHGLKVSEDRVFIRVPEDVAIVGFEHTIP